MARPADPNARAQLISAARREFLRHGLQRARIEDITQACKLSKGSFYLHFESKEALFRPLVAQLDQGMDSLLAARMAEQQAFFAKYGALRKRDFLSGSPRLRQFEAIERKHDRAVLDLLWELRDVSQILVSGSQGTEFENVMWGLVDRELKRVVGSCEALRAWGACRPDVPATVIGSMLIGSWLLMLRQMSSLTEKPDLEAWIDGLNRVFTGGIGPQAASPISKRHRAAPRARRVV